MSPLICECYSSGKNEAIKSNPSHFTNGCAKQPPQRLLSLRNEDFDTIVEQIPEEFRSLQEIAGALGDAAGKYGNLQKGQYWYEIAYKSKDPSPGVAISYATSMLLSIAEDKLVLITGTVTINQKTQLENIIAIYSDAYTKIADRR